MKKVSKSLIFVFLVVMGALTFVSRAVYHQRLPKVSTNKPSAGTLTYSYDIAHFTWDTDEMYYEHIQAPLPHGLTVTKVHVIEGDYVDAGDPLVSFYQHDLEYLLACLQQSDEPDEELLALVEMLLRQNSTWNASVSGVICACEINQGEVYKGLAPIASIATGETPIHLLFASPEGLPVLSDSWIWSVVLSTSNVTETVEVQHMKHGLLSVTLPEAVRGQPILSLTLEISSYYARMIVPTFIIQSQCVPVVVDTVDAWGQPMKAVRMIPIIVGDADATNTIVLSGLSEEHDVIIDADKPFADGEGVRME